MPTRVAINGFGRIGRGVAARRDRARRRHRDRRHQRRRRRRDARAPARFDSVYGPFPGAVEAATTDVIVVDGRGSASLAERDPADLPWDELGVDVVIESTGRFRTRADAARASGGRRAQGDPLRPRQGPSRDANVVLGVNFDEVYDPERHHIITNASCTTNCLAPVAKVLHETVGIRHGLMTTIHAYTADQNLLDAPHKDLRRARAAARQPHPDLHRRREGARARHPRARGRLNGYAVRVPVPTGSLVDLTVEAERPTSVEEINAAFAAARRHAAPLAGILAYSEEPIVSADIVKSPYSSIFDAPLTTVIDGTQVKVVAWYDNEWGYANRLVELAMRVGALIPAVAAR